MWIQTSVGLVNLSKYARLIVAPEGDEEEKVWRILAYCLSRGEEVEVQILSEHGTKEDATGALNGIAKALKALPNPMGV